MRGEKNEKVFAKNSLSSCWHIGYSYIPAVHNGVKSIWIDFVCRPELSVRFIAAAGRARRKCARCVFFKPRWGQTHTHQYISLSSLPRSLPSALKRLPTCPPTRFAATRCCFAQPTTTTTSSKAAAAASPYQHASARQMIHPLRVL